MRSCTATRLPAQGGFVVLLMLVALLLGAGGYAYVRMWGGVQAVAASEATHAQTLLQIAKQALLTHLSTHGRLPCPGNFAPNPPEHQAPTCGARAVGSLGVLPWSSLSVNPGIYGNVCLFYAVSGRVKNSPLTPGVNHQEHGNFRVIDVQGKLLAGSAQPNDTANNAVAVILMSHPMARCNFAYGTPMETVTAQLDRGYVRFNGEDILVNHQMLSAQQVPQAWGSTVHTFAQGYVNGGFAHAQINDQLVWIGSREFDYAMRTYAATQASLALANYYRDSAAAVYPYASTEPAGDCNATQGALSGFFPAACAQVPPAGGLTWDSYVARAKQASHNAGTEAGQINCPENASELPTGLRPMCLLLRDGWLGSVEYTVAERCVGATVRCNGGGAFLAAQGAVAQPHTRVRIGGRDVPGGALAVNAFTQ